MQTILHSFDPDAVSSELLERLRSMDFDVIQYAKFAGIFLFGILLISTMFRFLFGKKAQIQIAVTSAIEILFVYVIYIAVWSLGLILPLTVAQLPMLTPTDGYFVFLPVLETDHSVLCAQLVHLLMIAFLVNLVNSLLRRPKNLFGWLLQHLLVVVVSMAVVYGLELLLQTFVPQGFSDHAPMILLIVLAVLVILGSMRLLVGAAIAFVSPLLGALYTFFFSNVVGRALSRAIVTTALLTGLIALLNTLGIYGVPADATALAGYLPLLAIAFGLWILIVHVFLKK